MSELVGKRAGVGPRVGRAAGDREAGVPGRQTLVEVEQHAAHGVSGPGGQLPFHEQIQRAFGRYDVSGVHAHGDERAAQANQAMGSMAYTRGEHVAFGGAPDLHTAAHEAAHVVQQRAGVNVAGGVGAAGDAHEQQANAIADMVVAGHSAEAFIGAFAPAGRGGGASTAGGGGTVAVQHQSREGRDGAGASASSSGDAHAASGGEAGGTPLSRVQAAIARSDVAALTQLQPELRRQLPAPEAVRALTVARQWAMERIVEIREHYRARLDAARQGATAASEDPTARAGGRGHGDRASAHRSGDRTSALHEVELEMDAECKAYIDALQQGDPQRRYQHTDAHVEAEVFAAIRLHGARRGEDWIGRRYEAESEARDLANVRKGEWCGAFAYAQMHEGASFDPVWTVHMQGTNGILQALRYQGMHYFWMWIDDQWRNMVEYHEARHSPRRYVELTGGQQPQDVQPGDILLVDHGSNGTADHIQTVLSFDGENVITIGGNEGQGQAGVNRRRSGLSLRDNPAIGVRPARDRVHGIGRWSIVDYERHIYFGQHGVPVASRTMPTEPPSQTSRPGRRRR